MSVLELGSYVTHAKLPELGTGEVLSAEKGQIRIRFASGERNFLVHLVVQHLAATDEAPPRPPPKTAKRVRAPKKAVPAKATPA
jgi:hypothetical protein